MSRKPNSPAGTDSSQDRRLRPGLNWAVAAVSLICLASLIWFFRGPTPGPASPVEPAGSGAEAEDSVGEDTGQPPDGTAAGSAQQQTGSEASASMAANTGQSPAPNDALPPAAPQTPVDPVTGALVSGLIQLTGTNVSLTAEGVAAWRNNFTNLLLGGSAAVPALRAFLDQKVDYAFSQEAWQTLGYGSARLAAIDALRQIGGPDAVTAMAGLLGANQSPKETAVLARNLEEASPGEYREQALAAARAGLTAAATSKDTQVDVAPFFEVFQHYGDASVIPELEKAMGQWKYYATISLANLPENAGVPSILRLADPASGSSSRVVALEMVAELAASNPEARQFLATQVANKTIAPNLWPYLTGPLAGDQYYPVDSAITQYPQLQSMGDLKTTHLAFGNQNLYTLPGNQNLSAEGINQRLALVENLLAAASEPAAIQALQQARATLTQRSTRAAAQTQPGIGTGQ